MKDEATLAIGAEIVKQTIATDACDGGVRGATGVCLAGGRGGAIGASIVVSHANNNKITWRNTRGRSDTGVK